jgi:hypothetical protein
LTSIPKRYFAEKNKKITVISDVIVATAGQPIKKTMKKIAKMPLTIQKSRVSQAIIQPMGLPSSTINMPSTSQLASLPPLQQIPTAEEEVESLSSSRSQATDVNSEIWCYCKQPDDGSKMTGCDGKYCTIVWFHTTCLRKRKIIIPKGKFFCPECKRKQQQFKKIK